MADERLNPNWGNELKAATNAAGEVVGVLKPQSDSARAPIVVAQTDPVTGVNTFISGGDTYSASKINPLLLSKPADYTSKAVYYKMNEGAGTSLADSLGNGPALTVNGTATEIWANANWLSCHSAGTFMQSAGNAYLNSLFSMVGFGGSLLIGFDYWYGAVNTSTETLVSLFRPANGGAGGGIRLTRGGGSGNLGIYYTNSAGSEASVFLPSEVAGELSKRLSIVFDFDFSKVATKGRLGCTVYRNKAIIRCFDFAVTALPVVETSGGLVIGGYYNGSVSQKMGAGSSNDARIARFFAMRQEKRNSQAAFYLADWWDTGSYELPQLIRSM